MTAEEFYKLYKKGKKMENEYFIAVDKKTLFEMMEAFAELRIKNKENGFNNEIINNENKKIFNVLEHF